MCSFWPLQKRKIWDIFESFDQLKWKHRREHRHVSLRFEVWSELHLYSPIHQDLFIITIFYRKKTIHFRVIYDVLTGFMYNGCISLRKNSAVGSQFQIREPKVKQLVKVFHRALFLVLFHSLFYQCFLCHTITLVTGLPVTSPI